VRTAKGIVRAQNAKVVGPLQVPAQLACSLNSGLERTSVLPMADLDDITSLRQVLCRLRRAREERRWWRGKLEGTAKQPRSALGARPS
jgi:hypothetical protein